MMDNFGSDVLKHCSEDQPVPKYSKKHFSSYSNSLRVLMTACIYLHLKWISKYSYLKVQYLPSKQLKIALSEKRRKNTRMYVGKVMFTAFSLEEWSLAKNIEI